MDQKKIGAFIAARRKMLGLTQAQLGERLGVSDKAVSKWERGVSLPDVSLYQPLCALLGVSLNDFFAGEIVAPEQTTERAEAAMLSIAADGDRKRRRMRRIAAAFAAVSLMLALLAGALWYANQKNRPQINTLRPYGLTAQESELLRFASPDAETKLFSFLVDQRIQSLTLFCTIYQNGVQTEHYPLFEPLPLDTHCGVISVSDNGISCTAAASSGGQPQSSSASVEFEKPGQDGVWLGDSETLAETAAIHPEEETVFFTFSFKGAGNDEWDYVCVLSAVFSESETPELPGAS